MTFEEALQKFGEYGLVEEVRHPIVVVSGLPGVKLSEMVVFADGSRGQVVSLSEGKATVLILANVPTQAGQKVARTGERLTAAVGEGLLGCVTNALGEVILATGSLPSTNKHLEVEAAPPLLTARAPVKSPLLTGVSLVDLLIPLGRGQRELVVGDKLTGKTSFLMTVLKNQAESGVVVIYAAIGKPAKDIKNIYDFAKECGALKNTIIVASSPSDTPSLIYFTPYTAMTMAEYFRNLGRDVLVFLDDLSAHARFYREVSLLARKFPGRDSYPGDVFYVHARLLERAGSFKTGSITCLPVAETTENDLTDYIVSNLVGITDGHLLFDSIEFIKGRRPAISTLLSVTRVGRQTQNVLNQDVSRTLTAFLLEYSKSQNFSYFGEELTDKIKLVLNRGEKLVDFFDQPITLIVPLPVQLTLIGMIWNDLFTAEVGARIHAYRQHLVDAYKTDPTAKQVFDSVSTTRNFKELAAKVAENKDYLIELCKMLKK